MAKLNRDEILRGLLQTLVDGWGKSAVQAAFETLESPAQGDKRKRSETPADNNARGAEALVAGMDLSPEHRTLLSDLARRFDEGRAFPTLGDIRSFLLSHQQSATDLKSRVQAFKRMLPILSRMSPKGLERLIARSHHSGPADLGEISDAIRGAGEDLRGKPLEEAERTEAAEAPVTAEVADAAESSESNVGAVPDPVAARQGDRSERRRLGLRSDIRARRKP